MSRWRFVLRSLTHHWRIHLAVVLGVAAATAVLTGALLVGDSVRGSLRTIALDRLGRIDHIILSESFFRTDLAAELAAQPAFQEKGGESAVPAIVLRGTVELTYKADPAGDGGESPPDTAQNGDPPNPQVRRAGQVTVLGVDDRFWQLGDRYGGGVPVGPTPLPDEGARQIVLNAPLAAALDAAVGDEVVLRLPRLSDVPADSPMGRKSDTIRNVAELQVVDIIPAEGLGRFALNPSQQLPLVAYLHPAVLQRALDQPDKANAIFVAGSSVDDRRKVLETDDLIGLLRPSLADFGLRFKRVRQEFAESTDGDPETVFDYFSLSSDRMLIPPEVDAAAEQAFAAHTPQPVYTYLANTIAKVPTESPPPSAAEGEEATASDSTEASSRPIPYSTIVAVDSSDSLGPLNAPDASPLPPLADDEIVLHSWAAEQLQAQPGDTIEVTYFEPESTHGRVVERTEQFRLKAVVPLTEPAQSYSGDEPPVYTQRPTRVNDPDLTPEVPGVTDKEALDDWDPPFPFDRDRIEPPDDLYWENHRTTPKAFVALDRGRALWASRFGRTTSFRIAASDSITADTLSTQLLDQLHRNRLAPGFTFLPVRKNAVQASSGATPFDVLFLLFSMFVIAAALMLVTLLFRLGIEQRAGELGTLLAVGLRRRSTSRIFALEGGLVASAGGILGIFGGVAYAWLMLTGLKTWWIEAVVTPFVSFHYTERSLMIGYFAGAVTALATFAWSIANLRRVPVRQLMAGQVTGPAAYVRRRHWLSLVLAWTMVVAAVALIASAPRLGGQSQAGAFFGAGAALLTAGLLLTWWWFRTSSAAGGTRGFSTTAPLIQLALRNAARNAGRSTLTIGLVAAASFLIVAVSAFQLQPSMAGTGGFTWIGETSQPVYQDLSDANGRDELGIIGDNDRLLSTSDLFGLRVQSGDDASCLNLFQAKRPRVIGITPAFAAHFDNLQNPRFAFAAAQPVARQAHPPTDEEATSEDHGDPRPNRKRPRKNANAWWLLEQPAVADAVPVILDKNTAMYALHLYGGVGEQFDMTDDITGRTIRFQVVGLLTDSIFQGNLLVGESHFQRLYPDVSGYRMFLIHTPPDDMDQVRTVLEDRLGDWGFHAADAVQRMESLQVVQNTYLQTFQSLGALGLLLGTFGLATVQLRNVFERRAELALMRAAGFRRGRLALLVLLENMLLLMGGLAIGVVAALTSSLPHMLVGGAQVPWATLATMLGLVLAAGLLTGLAAVRATLRAPLLPALRGD